MWETDWLFKKYARKDIERFITYVLLMLGRENVRWSDLAKVKHLLFGLDNRKFGEFLSVLWEAGFISSTEDHDDVDSRSYTITDKALEEMKNEHS